MRSVLVTRPLLVAAPLIGALREKGYNVIHEPLLTVEHLRVSCPQVPEPCVVMITSRVTALLLEEGDVPKSLVALPFYCVGEQTAQGIRDIGFHDVYSSGGDSQQLAAKLLRETPQDATVLHIGGENVQESGWDILRKAGRRVVHWPLYRVHESVQFSSDTWEALRGRQIDAAMFFSVRTARVFVRVLAEKDAATCCANMDAIALSKPVSDVLSSLIWQREAVAQTPTQAAMIAALETWGQ